jgi:hypothetical protein
MMRLGILVLTAALQGCGFLRGADEDGNPVPGVLDVLGATARAVGGMDPTGGGVAGALATLSAWGAVRLRSWAIRRAGRRDDNLNGVPDDAEAAK